MGHSLHSAGALLESRASGATKLWQRIIDHWWTRQVFVPWFFTRALLSLVGLLSFYMFQAGTHSTDWQINAKGQMVDQPQGGYVTEKRWFVNIWSRWDSEWYYTVAHEGYHRAPASNPEALTNLNFFPVYPLLMRTVRLLGDDRPIRYYEMGILISNAATLAALTLLVMLARLDFGEQTAARSALSLAIFPSSCFLSAVYAEGLFTLLVIASFYSARKGRWWLAGLLGMIASATRAPGFLLAVGLGVEYLQQRNWRWQAIRGDVLAVAMVPLGLAAFLGYQHYFLSPDQNVTSGFEAHKRFITWPWNAFVPFFNGTYATLRWENSLQDLGYALFALTILLISLRHLRWSYCAFGLATWLFIASTNSLSGIPRFILPIFPIFLTLGVLMQRAWFEKGYLMAGAALGALTMALFATWHWYA